MVSKDGSKVWSSQMWQHFLTHAKHIQKMKISMDPTTKWPCAKNSQATCQDLEAYKILIKRFKCKISFFESGLHQKNLLKSTYWQKVIKLWWKKLLIFLYQYEKLFTCLSLQNNKIRTVTYRIWNASRTSYDILSLIGEIIGVVEKIGENKIGCLVIWCHEQEKNSCLFMGFYIYFRFEHFEQLLVLNMWPVYDIVFNA